MAPKHTEIAADLRREIEAGQYPPGSSIPSEVDLVSRYGVSRSTIRTALRQLATDGLVRPGRGRRGTVVQAPPVTVSLARYGRVLRPGAAGGPWETACADAGVPSRVDVVEVDQRAAPADVAARLGIDAGALVVYRRRHMYAGAARAQVQETWMPADIATGPLTGSAKVAGGVFGALTAAGRPPATVSETVSARAATDDDAAGLGVARGAAILLVERLTHDAEGIQLELLRLIANPQHVRLMYDDLPLGAA